MGAGGAVVPGVGSGLECPQGRYGRVAGGEGGVGGVVDDASDAGRVLAHGEGLIEKLSIVTELLVMSSPPYVPVGRPTVESL